MIGVDLVRLTHLRVSPMLYLQVTYPGVDFVEALIIHLEGVVLELNVRDARRLGEMQVRAVAKQDCAEWSPVGRRFKAEYLCEERSRCASVIGSDDGVVDLYGQASLLPARGPGVKGRRALSRAR